MAAELPAVPRNYKETLGHQLEPELAEARAAEMAQLYNNNVLEPVGAHSGGWQEGT